MHPWIACGTVQWVLVGVGEVSPAVAPLPVGADQERSSSGFSAWFTLSQGRSEKIIERDMRGLRGVIYNLNGIFFIRDKVE